MPTRQDDTDDDDNLSQHQIEVREHMRQEGRLAWKRIKKAGSKLWTDWLKVGETLLDGSAQAKRAAGVSKRKGKGYNTEFSKFLRDYQLDDIDGATRIHLLDLMDNRGAVEDWRNTELKPWERLEYNHPNTVWRKWKASLTRQQSPEDADRRRARRAATLSTLEREVQNKDRRIGELEAQVQELEAARETAPPAAATTPPTAESEPTAPVTCRDLLDKPVDEVASIIVATINMLRWEHIVNATRQAFRETPPPPLPETAAEQMEQRSKVSEKRKRGPVTNNQTAT
jgi:hypothetical protein